MTTLAHGGGIPEAISVLAPLVAVVVLLRAGARKARREEQNRDEDAGPVGSDDLAG